MTEKGKKINKEEEIMEIYSCEDNRYYGYLDYQILKEKL